MIATRLMKSILTSPDSKPRVAFISQLIVPLLAIDEASRVEACSREISLSLSDGECVGEVVVEVEFIVADWNLVWLIAKEIANGRLRAELCGVIDASGDHDGIVALFNERTAMTVFASTETSLTARIGGFQDSADFAVSREAEASGANTEKSNGGRRPMAAIRIETIRTASPGSNRLNEAE